MTEPARHSPHQNHLLDALPASDYERLAPHLELIPMPLGDVLYESGGKLRFVYFPTSRCRGERLFGVAHKNNLVNARRKTYGSCYSSRSFVLPQGSRSAIDVSGDRGATLSRRPRL